MRIVTYHEHIAPARGAVAELPVHVAAARLPSALWLHWRCVETSLWLGLFMYCVDATFFNSFETSFFEKKALS